MGQEFTPLQRFFQDKPRLCPHEYGFSLADLKRACPDFLESDPFYKTASLFIGLFSDLREQLSALKIFDRDSGSLAKDCIAFTNHDSIVAFKQQTAQPNQNITAGPRDFISVLSDRSVTAASGAKLNLDESFPSLADTLQTILDALPHLARGAKEGGGIANDDIADELVKFGQLSNAYRVSKEDWENALWLNFRLKEDEDVLEQPQDALALALRANYFRHQSHEFNLRIRPGKEISSGARSVPGVYQASLGGVSKLPAVKALLRVLGNTRVRKSVTLKDTFKIYSDIRSIAQDILGADLDVYSLLERSAIPRTKFITEMSRKFGVAPDALSEVLEILTYKNPRQSNIWISPIQIIEDTVVLILPALAYSNVVRFLELTAIRNSLPFSEIGRDFERMIKRKAKEILQKHPFRGAAHVLPARTFETSLGSEEIDLAINIGSVLFAIEVKYDHFPTEPHETYNFIRGARDASDQIARKAKFLADNLAALKLKGLVGHNVKTVFGMVLNNTMLLSGVSLNKIPIIDQDILESYLGNVEEKAVITGHAIYSGAFTDQPFYDSREKFEKSATSYFSDPPQLERYRAMLSRVKFSRRGGSIRKRGYDLALYDMRTVTDGS